MRIDYSHQFIKHLRKAPKKIQLALRYRLELFLKDPRNPQLRIHSLQGKYRDYKSLNITGDWRALYRELKEDKEIIYFFEMLGTHSQLYK